MDACVQPDSKPVDGSGGNTAPLKLFGGSLKTSEIFNLYVNVITSFY
jgi:hypothetical protein